MKLYALTYLLDQLDADQKASKIIAEAAEHGITPEDIVEALVTDDLIDLDAMEVAPVPSLSEKAEQIKPLLPVTEVKPRPQTTCKIKVFND